MVQFLNPILNRCVPNRHNVLLLLHTAQIMQIKWLEDFIALAMTQNFSRAAELRNVTHPAFGRRIQALEAWAGTPLIERGASPVALTAAGERFLESSTQTVRSLESARVEMLSEAGRSARTVTIATGRTLARTVVADWLVRLQPVVRNAQLRIVTGSLADTAHLLERNEVDLTLVYHHPVLNFRLDARQFSHLTLASDKLVPVARAGPDRLATHLINSKQPIPLLAYGRGLALARLLEDHLANNPLVPQVERRIECDSADALLEYVQKGFGIAWLPWSMVQSECKAGRLALAGDRRMEVKMEVRLYRPKRQLGALVEAVWKSVARERV